MRHSRLLVEPSLQIELPNKVNISRLFESSLLGATAGVITTISMTVILDS
jgi:hypothetical protein